MIEVEKIPTATIDKSMGEWCFTDVYRMQAICYWFGVHELNMLRGGLYMLWVKTIGFFSLLGHLLV